MLTLAIMSGAMLAGPSDAAFLYATRGDNKVHLVLGGDLATAATIDVGVGCHELATSSDGRWAIGSAYGGPGKGHNPPDSRLAVIDLREKKLHRVVDLGELKRPNDMAFLPGTSEAIVTVEMPPRLVRVNAETGEFGVIELEHPAGHMMALAPDGKTAYVAHVVPGRVSVVDLEAKKVTASIETPAGAEGIACSPDGKRLWVACNRSDAIVVIDTAEKKVVQRIDAPGFPFRVRFSPDGGTVAVSFPKTAEVGFYDAADPAKLERVGVKDELVASQLVPTSIAFSADGATLCAVCDGPAPQLVLVNTKVRKVAARTTTGPIPDALAACASSKPPAGS